LWELLENSRKFHPQSNPAIEIRAELGPGLVRLQVRDDGTWLSPAQLARVWSPYYQAEKVTSGEVRGMGLGLALTANVIWGIGGQCQIANREDRAGAVVTLSLPRAAQPAL
ncbi:MAG TPA: ATP-binding protein, partial [Terriglobales bacterium]|nr:ATP-binding protein [Terriglobales bacterium]